MNLDHIGIEVSDSFTMELFYKKFFDFRTVYRYRSSNQKGLRTAVLSNGKVKLELLERENSKPERPERPNHIAFYSPDVNKEYARLLALGLENIDAPRVTGDGCLEASASDPEGNIIEISKRIRAFPGYKISAVIFDLDGTVIDSEGNYYEADRRLLHDYGIILTPAMKHKYVGTGNLEMMKDLKTAYGIKDSIETLLARKNEYYMEKARNNTKVFPEMIKFIRLLKASGYKLGIASGTSAGVLEEIIDMTGLRDYFTAAVSAESVERGKPAPDVFIETSRRLGVDQANCAVVEDSRYGVEAAVRASMPCIAVPYLADAPVSDRFFMADLIYMNGMKGFNARRAIKWVLKHS